MKTSGAGILREARALEDAAVIDLLRKLQLKGQDFQISPDWMRGLPIRATRNRKDGPDGDAPTPS